MGTAWEIGCFTEAITFNLDLEGEVRAVQAEGARWDNSPEHREYTWGDTET